MADYSKIINAIISCDIEGVPALVQKALDAGSPAGEILNAGLITAMDTVGEKMQSGEMFIPEVLMAAQAMAAGVSILKPLLSEGDSNSAGKVVIGTVKGDLHDIGKNLVSMMVQSAGFEVIDLGVDVEPQAFVNTIKEKNAQFLGLSALLTTTMPMMKQTIDAVTEAGLREQVKILVGGAPVTDAFAKEIGADAYAPDAGSASKALKKMAA